jgi:cation diffusion facilitator family transporter
MSVHRDQGRLRREHGGVSSLTRAYEARTRWVVAVTFATMIGEVVAGRLTRSMALTADGWHMATHAGALGVAAVAYWYARTRASSGAFAFGTGKVLALAGYSSGVVLALVALWMVAESAVRLTRPEAIAFSQALPVAVLGLAVNLVCMWILHVDERHGHVHDHHEHDHDHGHDHAHSGHDHNYRGAYLHVLADATTSLLAIVALLGGRWLGWAFLDPAMGIVGGVVIARWSWGLCRDAAVQLVDRAPSGDVAERVRRHVEGAFAGTQVVELRLWQVGPGALACIVAVTAPQPLPTSAYRDAILRAEPLAHLTVEVRALAGPVGLATPG